MSIRTTYDVSCDACGMWITGAYTFERKTLIRKALRVAQRAGWSRDTKSKYLDLCPECLLKERTGELE
jgi:hypothetical protein